MDRIAEQARQLLESGYVIIPGPVTNGQAHALTTADEAVTTAELYRRKYANAAGEVFSRFDGTDLSHALEERLGGIRVPVKGLDMGAGKGVHAIDLATNLRNLVVTAVEINDEPFGEMLARLQMPETQDTVGSRVIARQEDVNAWLRSQRPASLDFVYGSSYGHFLSPEEETYTFGLARSRQLRGAFIAISQKTFRDGLLGLPLIGDPIEEADWIWAKPKIDRIGRRFLKPNVLAKRLAMLGYEVIDQFNWSVLGYDAPGVMANFDGVLARAA